MEISVEFDGRRWRYSPDPAIVDRGTLISWKFQNTTLTTPAIRWTAYFVHGSPFRAQGIRFFTTTLPTLRQQAGRIVAVHAGITVAVTAYDPGDYKYGVRAEDTMNRVGLGDDDPRLIVRA